MTTMTETGVTTQVYRVYIKAAPEAIWEAITKPEWMERYGYGGRFESEPRAGSEFRILTGEAMRSMGAPEVGIDGEVVEADPPLAARADVADGHGSRAGGGRLHPGSSTRSSRAKAVSRS